MTTMTFNFVFQLDPPYPGPVRGTLRDTVVGRGAADVTVKFYKLIDGEWELWTTK